MIKLYEPYNVCTSTAVSTRWYHLWMDLDLLHQQLHQILYQTNTENQVKGGLWHVRLVQDYQSLCSFNFLKYGAQLYQWVFFYTVDTNNSTLLNKL